MKAKQTQKTRPAAAEALRLGERLRQLRSAAGLTQSDLAGDRFSKEYVSQIERGKTRPTRETIAWLAAQLGVDAGFLASGVATDERGRLEGALARAEALYEAGEDDEAASAFERSSRSPCDRQPRAPGEGARGTGLAKMRLSDHRAALELLSEARAHPSPSRSPTSSGRRSLPARRLPLSAEQHAVRDRALRRGARARRASGLPCDALKADITRGARAAGSDSAISRRHGKTSSCALELSRGARTPHHRCRILPGIARSPIARVTGCSRGRMPSAPARHTRARRPCSRRRAHEQPRRRSTSCWETPTRRWRCLKRPSPSPSSIGRNSDAGRAVSSLAQIHLRTGDLAQAEEQARHALEAARGPRRLGRRGRERAARAWSAPCSSRGASTRPKRRSRCRGWLRRARVRKSSRSRVGCKGRSRGARGEITNGRLRSSIATAAEASTGCAVLGIGEVGGDET